MCCEADWKREVVQDYKWEYVDVKGFHRNDAWTRIQYMFVYIFLLKNIAIYGLDIFTASTMLINNNWTNKLYTKCQSDDVWHKCDFDVKFGIAKWVFVGCIIFSFVLLAYEAYKARNVIKSRDIAYSFTNVMANDYYSLKDYNNFCLFCRISSSRKHKDKIAFFVFFSFKSWKRTLLADGPRQSINAIILWFILRAYNFSTTNIQDYWDGDTFTLLLLLSMMATVFLFLFSLAQIIIAAVFYVPLLCYVQGNLKEYVCHKVDKRIGDIIRKCQKKRIERNAKLEKTIAQGGQIKNGKGEFVDASLLQPTLPSISLDALDTKPPRPMSPAPRAASPAPRRISPPAPRRLSPDGQGMDNYMYAPDTQATYPDDIYDAYSEDAHYLPQDDYGSKTSLIGSAAPPGSARPPLQGYSSYGPTPAYASSTSVVAPYAPTPYAGAPSYPPPPPPATRGAPEYPPGTAAGTPSYPPPASYAQAPYAPRQYEATRQYGYR